MFMLELEGASALYSLLAIHAQQLGREESELDFDLDAKVERACVAYECGRWERGRSVSFKIPLFG